MKSRFTALFAIAAILLQAVPVSAASLSDVGNTPYKAAFAYLQEKGVVEGYRDGTGHPFASINRAEALKVVLSTQRILREDVERTRKNMPPLPLFYDVDQKAWYGPYVETGFEQKIVRGYPDGSFRPGNLVSTEEAAALLLRAFGEEPQGSAAQISTFIENREGEWFTPYVNTVIQRNLALESGTLRLGQPMTRGAFFEMVYRQMSVREQKIAAFPRQPVQSVQTQAARPATGSSPTIADLIQAGPALAHVTVAQQSSARVVTRSQSDHASEKYFSISMPSLGITDLTVTHPSDPFSSKGVLEVLKQGVGHLFSYPGGGGKIMIYGHSSGYPWDVSEYTKIFRKVNELKAGDKIYVTYGDQLFTYEVTQEQTINASDTSPFNDNGTGEELILYTCWPPDSIAQRYLVHARPVDKVALR